VESSGKHTVLRHPLFGIIGTVVGIIAFGFAIFAFQSTRERRELTYYVHPNKALVIRQGQASGISVYLGGETVSTDVTAAQVAVWNNGSASIRKAHVLSPVRLVVGQDTRILEASLRSMSREVVGFAIDTSSVSAGIVPVTWDILERNDGAVVQLIYAGPPDVEIRLDGIVEGQHQVRVQRFPGEIRSPSEQVSQVARSYRSMAWFGTGGALFVITGTLLVVWLKGTRPPKGTLAMFLVNVLMLAGLAIYFWIKLQRLPTPPFAF